MMYDNTIQREKHLVTRPHRWTETDKMAEPKSSFRGVNGNRRINGRERSGRGRAQLEGTGIEDDGR